MEQLSRTAPTTRRPVDGYPAFAAETAGYHAPVAPPITTIDLFAGAGGLSAGLQKASPRFRPITAVEASRPAAATYRANHPETDVVASPIQQWIAASSIPTADLIVGGPPCQGFSALGRQDVRDVRNALWRQYVDVIVASRPKYFIVENVPQFLDSDQFTAFLRLTRRRNRLEDYDIDSRGVLNAADYGAPQLRRRAVLIGRRRDMPPLRLPLPDREPPTYATVSDAWVGIEPAVTDRELPDRSVTIGGVSVPGEFKTTELHLTRKYTSLSMARIERVPPGGNRFDIPRGLLPACWRAHTTGSADVMGRLHWDRPSVTIRTEFVKPEKGRYLHPDQHRAITLLEGARLQGFDDDYRWCGSKSDIAKQIGNAVPIPLAEAIGRHLVTVL